MPWFQVTFMEAERDEFDSEFDEDRIAAALPGKIAYLATIEEQPTISEALKAQWRRLKGE